MPLVVVMPGKCPKCGARLVKRTGVSKKTNKQYTYYCCEFLNSKDESRRGDFMTWDVPVKDNCPICGQTMFKKSGRGFKRPFCINENCSNFTPEEKRGGYVKKTADTAPAEGAAPAEETAEADKTTAKKTAAKKTTAKRTASTAKKAAATKKTAAKKSATKKAASTSKTARAKKTTAKKTTAKKAAAEQAEE